MASRERRSSATRRKSNKGGSTLFGVILGLILGLAVAAAVAWFVTQKPVPFADKASRTRPQTLLPDVRHAPDPNVGLAGNNRGARSGTGPSAGSSGMTVPGTGAGVPATRPSARSPSNPPGQQGQQQPDDIAALLATLGSAQSSNNTPPVASISPNPANTARPTATIYFLQAGAFRSENDAQSTRARVLMLGLPAQVQVAQLDGAPLYRVRVGPFRGIDEMNRSREQLSRAQIESSIARP